MLDGQVDREGGPLLTVGSLDQWNAKKKKIPVGHIERFVNLLTGYPWKCTETFAVFDGKVQIRDTVAFLPWTDDWNFKPVFVFSHSAAGGVLD